MYTIRELEGLNVVNPTFIPSARDYARAIFARNRAWEIEEKSAGTRTLKIRTKKPFLWALCLQHTRKTCVLAGLPFWPEAWADSEAIRVELSKLKEKRNC